MVGRAPVVGARDNLLGSGECQGRGGESRTNKGDGDGHGGGSGFLDGVHDVFSSCYAPITRRPAKSCRNYVVAAYLAKGRAPTAARPQGSKPDRTYWTCNRRMADGAPAAFRPGAARCPWRGSLPGRDISH